MNKIETMTDLLLFRLFFLKCHELEKTYEIEDECVSLGDITSRKPDYRLTREEYFNLTIIPLLYQEYLKLHPDLEKTFLELESKQKEEELKKSEEEKIKEENNKRRDKIIGLFKILFPCLMIALGIALGLIYQNLILGLCLAAGGIIPSIIISVIYQMKHLNFKGEEKVTSLEEYINKSKEYKAYLDEMKAKFIDICNQKEEYIYQIREELKKVKDKLLADTEIPNKCINEEIVNALLMILLDDKASTLKEAMEVYLKEEVKLTNLNEKSRKIISNVKELENYKLLEEIKIVKGESIINLLTK